MTSRRVTRTALMICLALVGLDLLQAGFALVNLYRSRTTVHALNRDAFDSLFSAGKLKGVAKDQRIAVIFFLGAETDAERQRYAADVERLDHELTVIRQRFPVIDRRDAEHLAENARQQARFMQAWFDIRDLGLAGKHREAWDVYHTRLMAATLGRRRMEDQLADDGVARGGRLSQAALGAASRSIPVVAAILLLTVGLGAGGFLLYARAIGRSQARLEEASAQLRQSEERFRRVFESSPIGIGLADLNGNWFRLNPAFCEMVGYTEPELLRLGWRAITMAEDLCASAGRIERLLATSGQTAECEERYRHRDGSAIWVNLKLTGVRDERDAPIHILAHAENISERKRAVTALAESEERFRRIFEDNASAMLSVDAHTGSICDANQAAADYCGYSRSELAGMNVTDISTQPGDQVIRERLRISRKRKAQIETRIRLASGEERDVVVCATAIDQGHGVRLFGIIHDITERKQAAEALQRSEMQLSEALQMARAGHWEYDVAEDVFTFNDNFYRIFRTTADEVGGYRMSSAQYASRFCHPGDAQVVAGEIAAALQTSEPSYVRQVEHRIRFAGGETGHVAVRFTLDKDERGRTVRIHGVNQDITELKRAEEVLSASQEKYRRLFEHATRLADHAARANAAKSEFLAKMSHEIRTPMNGVIGMARLLLTDELSGVQRRRAGLLRDSAEALLALLNDILDLSKIEAGKLELAPGEFVLPDLLEGVIELMAPRAHEKGLSLELAGAGGLPRRLVGDASRLRQMLLNLVSNAIKFTSRGGVSVSVLPAPGETDLVKFEVRDTGIGIPASKVPLLFTPFCQLPSESAANIGGTGLGLAIVRQLAEKMGGSVGCESSINCGSLFWFTARLPAAIGTEAAPPAPAARIGEPTHQSGAEDPILTPASLWPSHDTPPARILLVEDNPVNQEVAAGLLHIMGHKTTLAENGVEALARLAEADFDIVLMDCQMPVMDGFEAVARIRDSSSAVRNHSIPIIAMTASVMESSRERCRAAGMNGFVSKPVDPSALAATIGKWMGRSDRPLPVPSGGASGGLYRFDREQLVRRLMGNGELARKVVAGFLASVPHQMAALAKALKDGDAGTTKLTAHSIKGASANVGLPTVRESAYRLEQLASTGDLSRGDGLLEELRSAFCQVVEELGEFIAV